MSLSLVRSIEHIRLIAISPSGDQEDFLQSRLDCFESSYKILKLWEIHNVIFKICAIHENFVS